MWRERNVCKGLPKDPAAALGKAEQRVATAVTWHRWSWQSLADILLCNIKSIYQSCKILWSHIKMIIRKEL